jgi:hypothetical protein
MRIYIKGYTKMKFWLDEEKLKNKRDILLDFINIWVVGIFIMSNQPENLSDYQSGDIQMLSNIGMIWITFWRIC